MNKIIQLKVKTITAIQNNIDYCFKQTVTFNAQKKNLQTRKNLKVSSDFNEQQDFERQKTKCIFSLIYLAALSLTALDN